MLFRSAPVLATRSFVQHGGAMTSRRDFVAGLGALAFPLGPLARALRAAPREQALLGLRSFEMRCLANGTHALRITDDWDLLVAFEDRSEGRVAVVEALVQRTRTNSECPS